MAISQLQEIKIKLNQLPQVDILGANPDFDKWYRDTRVTIEHIFNITPERVKEFTSISFFNAWLNLGSYNVEDSVNYHNRARHYTNTLLDSFIDEIKKFGIKNNLNKSLSEVQLVEKILKNFHRFARQILIRHLKRDSIEIKDEYDVQDLLHAILRLYFDDVRPEESIPSYAGSNSRIDFVINDLGIAIEVKKTSKNLKDKEIGEQLLIDIGRYQTNKNVKTLICFVYDPDGLIKNPIGLENDLMQTASNLEVKAIICPKF